ncbi:MAG: radical SAM protein, partial [Candidatus Bathyarchaeia archaeon]
REETYINTRGVPLFETKCRAIENCRKEGLDSIVLVPTVVKGVNDDQLGAIIDFAIKNIDVVRCVNFQPVSITGRISYEKRKEMRITIPDCTRLIEEQTKGLIKVSDFYPVPVVVPVARAIGAIKGRLYPEFTVHEHCGMATFLLRDGGNLVPITRFADVEKFMDAMNDVYEAVKRGEKRRAQVKLFSATMRNVKLSLIRRLLSAVFKEGSYEALGNFMRNVLMVGMMHFQDAYNFDLERLERCGIHYAVPDGRIIPFCAMNTLYRPQIEKQFSIPLMEWLVRKQKA